MPRTHGIRLNDRRLSVLVALGEYGVLDIALCESLCFRGFSQEWARQNLARLAQAGLVRATALSVWRGNGGGRIPLLYSLTPAGAAIVRDQTGDYPRRVLRSDPSPETFWHRLQIVRVRAAFDRGAGEAGLAPPAWIFEQDLRPDARRLPIHRRRQLYHEFPRDGRVVTCRPDAAALLTVPRPGGDEGGASTLAVHFEIDRSTEGTAQCAAKLAGYDELYASGAFARYWPALQDPVHRIFWVVPSEQRFENLARAFRGFPVAPLIRLTTFADCRPERVLTEPVWRGVDLDAPMTLYRPPGTGGPPRGGQP